MLDLALSFVARFFAPLARRSDPIAIPIRRDDWRGARRGDRRN